MAVVTKSSTKTTNGATVAYEAQLWQMAGAPRGSVDAAEYKHAVLRLIFLKYVSDAFENTRLEAEWPASSFGNAKTLQPSSLN